MSAWNPVSTTKNNNDHPKNRKPSPPFTESHLSLLRLRLFSRLGTTGFPGGPAFPSFDLGTGVLGTGLGKSPALGGGPGGGTGVGGLTRPGCLGGWDGWAGVETGAFGAGWCGLGLAATVLAGWGGCIGGWGPTGLACCAFGGSAGGCGFATTGCALAGTTCGLAAGVCGLAAGGCAGGWGLGGGLWGAWGLATTWGLPSNDFGVTGFGGGAGGTVFGCTVFGPLAAVFLWSITGYKQPGAKDSRLIIDFASCTHA